MMSTFSLFSSRTMFFTRAPRMPTQAPTGSTFSFGAVDRDLRAVAGFAGNALDLDGAVSDFADFRFKQAAHEIRVAAGKDDLRAARAVLHGHDIGANAVADVVVFGLHALAGSA